jgi:hypothetical protein
MKNRAFVLFVCIAFLAVMAGMVYAKGNTGAAVTEPDEICEPMSKGFWKRICDGATGDKKLHNLTPIEFDPDLTLRDQTLCEALQVKTQGDACLRAESQEAALAFNVEYDLLSESCPIVREDGSETTVGVALDEIWDLINAGDCKDAASYAECINSGDCLDEDPYYVANLFNVEQNTFYKDIYAKVSNWLNGILKTS